MRHFPQFESVLEAAKHAREARANFQQQVDLKTLPVEVIRHVAELNKIIGGLVELNTIEKRSQKFSESEGDNGQHD